MSRFNYRWATQQLKDLGLRVIKVGLGDITLILNDDLVVDSSGLGLIDDGANVAHASIDLDKDLP